MFQDIEDTVSYIRGARPMLGRVNYLIHEVPR
jgi:hypothetical protein